MDATVTVSEAAQNLAELVRRARLQHEETTLVEDGEPVARIVPVQKRWKSAQELAAVLREGPHLDPEDAAAFEEDIRAMREAFVGRFPEWD